MFEVVDIVRDTDATAVAIIEFDEHLLKAHDRSPALRFIALDSRQIAGGVENFIDRRLTSSPKQAMLHRNYKTNGECVAA